MARAAAHQARLQSQAAAPPKLDKAVSAVVKLPFSGKLLPLYPKPSAAPLPATPSLTSSSMFPTTPRKLLSTSQPTIKKYWDVNVVNKQLFPHQLSQADDHHAADELSSQNYQEKEKILEKKCNSM
jgi:hypothetical protein